MRNSALQLLGRVVAGLLLAALAALVSPVQAQQQRPNIVVIMGDDVGWSNIGAYNQGIMSGRTPSLDRLAAEGLRFTDYYAEASCAPPDGRTSSPGNCRFAPASQRSDRPGHPSASPMRPSPSRMFSDRWVMRPANSARTIWVT